MDFWNIILYILLALAIGACLLALIGGIRLCVVRNKTTPYKPGSLEESEESD